jgi:hypothetical protein
MKYHSSLLLVGGGGGGHRYLEHPELFSKLFQIFAIYFTFSSLFGSSNSYFFNTKDRQIPGLLACLLLNLLREYYE